MYQWLRYYDSFDPIVGSTIDLHTQLPLSRFGLKGIKDPKIKQEYEDMMEEMDAFSLIYDQLREYWLIGESITYNAWDKEANCFTDGELLMSEYIDVRGHYLIQGRASKYEYFFRIDESAQEFLKSETDEYTEQMKQDMPPEILEAMEGGGNQDIRIDPFNLLVFMRKQSRYNIRGTSIILRVLKDLIYQDKLRESQYVTADRFITPREIWKVGSDALPADATAIENLAELIQSAENRPLFNLVTHHAVNHEIVSGSGKVMPLTNEFNWVEDRILTGLFTNKAVTTGSGPNFATASVATRALMSRYIPVRTKLENAWRNKIFLPIAIANNYRAITPAELAHGVRKPYADRLPVVPQFDWMYKTNLLDDAQYRNILIQLKNSAQLPMKVICDGLGIDYEYAKEWLKKEEGDIFDPTYKKYVEDKRKQSSLDDNVNEQVTRVWESKRDELRKQWYKSLENAGIKQPKKIPLPKDLQGTGEEMYKFLKERKPIGEDGIVEKQMKDVEERGEEGIEKAFSFESRGGLGRKVKAIKQMIVEYKDNPLKSIILNTPRNVDNLSTIADLEKKFGKENKNKKKSKK